MRKKLLLSGTFMFIWLLQVIAQKAVTGKITDTGDKPIFNASVLVKGSNVGTNTDEQGNFSITVPKGKNVLVVSSVGFEPSEVSVTGNTVHVTLGAHVSTLNDVVVVGYLTTRK